MHNRLVHSGTMSKALPPYEYQFNGQTIRIEVTEHEGKQFWHALVNGSEVDPRQYPLLNGREYFTHERQANKYAQSFTRGY
jgi:hypothetical protein